MLMSFILEAGTASELDQIITGVEPVGSLLAEITWHLDRTPLVLKVYAMRLSHFLSTCWEAEEWLQVCSRRPVNRFFGKLLAIRENEPSLDMTDVDEHIRDRGLTWGYLSDLERIPGIPPSH
jgi:hypothetical protein